MELQVVCHLSAHQHTIIVAAALSWVWDYKSWTAKLELNICLSNDSTCNLKSQRSIHCLNPPYKLLLFPCYQPIS